MNIFDKFMSNPKLIIKKKKYKIIKTPLKYIKVDVSDMTSTEVKNLEYYINNKRGKVVSYEK
jgi:hypothetical protein